MLLLIVFLMCLFVACGAGLLAAYSDFKGMVIPNMYSALVVGSFVVAFGLLWLAGRDDVFVSIWSHLLAALVVFGVTAAMFALKGLGAADSKLGTAYALWAGLSGLLPFLFYMAVIGGLLGVAGLVIKKQKPFKAPKEGGWVDRLQKGESKVPYGIAIVGGALASFLKIGYFNGDVMASFLL